MSEKITFKLESNLDKIADQVNKLSKNVSILSNNFEKKNVLLFKQNKLEQKSSQTVKEVSSEYVKLTSNINSFFEKNNDFNDSNKINTKDIIITSNNNNILNKYFNNLNEYQHEKELEKRIKKIREIENNSANFVLKILDKINALGNALILNTKDLKAFELDFMNSFSANPFRFFGAGQAMKDAFDLMKMFQQMRHELAYLSDSSGDASKALDLVYKIAGGSAVASGTATGIVRALADQGFREINNIKQMGILAGNLQAATGLAASQWASFTGELAFNYNIPQEGLEKISSALIGTNLRGAQLEQTMGVVNKVLQTTAFIAGKPTEESIYRLTKVIGASVMIFQSMGISAEKAGNFIERVVNPDNLEQTNFMFAKLGISASEYAGYLNDINGQEKLLQKTMENLPKLAQEISDIKDPYARLQLAKTLGLDMQIVRNMSGKTKEEIQQMIIEYSSLNKGKESLESKKKRMAAEAAKFEDMMLGLKLTVLSPIMNFLSGGNLNNFIETLPTIANTIMRFFEALVPVIKVLTSSFNELVPILAKFVKDFIAPFVRAFPMILDYLFNFIPFLGVGDTKINSPTQKMYSIVGNILSAITKLYLLMMGWKGLNYLGDFLKDFKKKMDPNKKNIVNATLDELSSVIKEALPKQPLYSSLGLGTKTMLTGGLLSSIFSFGDKLSYILASLGGQSKEVLPGDINLKQYFKRSLTNVLMYTPVAKIPGASMFGLPYLGKDAFKNIGSIKTFSNQYRSITKFVPASLSTFLKESLPYLLYFFDLVSIFTSQNKQDQYSAIGGLIGDLSTRAIMHFVAAPLISGLIFLGLPLEGAVGTVATIALLAPLAVRLFGDFIGGKVGAKQDLMDQSIDTLANERTQILSNNISNAIQNIFSAFELGDTAGLSLHISALITEVFERAILSLMSHGILPFEVASDFEKKSPEKYKEKFLEFKYSAEKMIDSISVDKFLTTELQKTFLLKEAQKKGTGLNFVLDKFNLKSKELQQIITEIENFKEGEKQILSEKDLRVLKRMIFLQDYSNKYALIRRLKELLKSKEIRNKTNTKIKDLKQEELDLIKQNHKLEETYINTYNTNIPTIYSGFSI
jgi:hypothetical protein